MDIINKAKEEILSFRDVVWGPQFQLLLSGISDCRSSAYRIARPPGKTWVFEYVTAGRGTLETEGIVCHPSAGDVYIAPAWKSHCYYSDEQAPWFKYWFNVSGPLPDALMKVYLPDNPCLFRNAVQAGELIRSGVEQLSALPRQEIPAFMERRIFELIRLLAASRQAAPLRKETVPAERLRAWMQKRITGKTPSLQEMADVIGFSPIHTIRLFRQATGQTPLDYLLSEKMLLACELLRSTRKPLKEIAETLGFSDPFYFSRLFRKRCGLPPAAYRNVYR